MAKNLRELDEEYKRRLKVEGMPLPLFKVIEKPCGVWCRFKKWLTTFFNVV